MTSHKNVTKAAGLMMVAILLSRLLGLFRDMAIASKFGQGALVSAYTVAFNLPDLLYFFLSSGALSGAFIPVFTEYFHTDRKREAWQIFSTIACFMGLVLLSAIVFTEIFTTPLVKTFAAPGYAHDQELTQLIVFLTRIILPCQLFFFMGGLMMGTLESRQNFKARAAGPVIYNLGIIFGVLVLSRWFSIAGLAWGALIGAFAGNVAFAFYHMKREGFEFYPNLNLSHPGVKKVGALALPVILGLSLPQIDVIINRYFATFLGEVAPAALNYANRLMQVPLGVFAQAAGTAILPTLAAYAAKNAIDDLRGAVSFGLRAILAINIPASLFMVVMADPIVRTVYMSGQFTSADVGPTEIALIYYSVGIFAWAGQAIVARGFFAMQDTLTPIVLGSVVTFIFLPLNLILMRVMGHAGLAFATSIAATIHLLGLIVLLRRRINGLESRKIASSAGRVLVASALMALLCYGIRLEMSKLIGESQFQDGDVRRPAQFAARLASADDPLSRYLESSLTAQTKQMAADYSDAERLSGPLTDSLTRDLNLIIKSHEFYDKERFSKIAISGAVRKLANSDSTGSELLHLNRELLEYALPNTLAVSDDGGWLSSIVQGKKRHLNSEISADRWLIKKNEITDLPKLAELVLDPKNRVSRYILAQLPVDTRNALREYNAECEKSADLPHSLTHDLNQVIAKDTIYSPARFAEVNLPASTLALAEKNPSGKQRASLNRLLLEAAYPSEIVNRPANRVETRKGSALTVLVAMVLGGVFYLGTIKLLKVEEANFVWDTIRRRLPKRPGSRS